MAYRLKLASLIALFCSVAVMVSAAPQIKIERIEQMPNMPQPYQMRDWRKVAHDFDALAFDASRTGDYLPMIRWDKGPGVSPKKVFALDSYVGWRGGRYELITCLGALNGASVAGIDKSRQEDNNWVELSANYFDDAPSIQMYLNSPSDKTGHSFWYELFPNVLFYRIYDRYQKKPKMADQFITVADQWHRACVGMGGSVKPWKVPYFNHTSYDFIKGRPVDNGIWREGGSAAAIAWIEYMAYVKTGDKKYLNAAKWGMDYLQQLERSPYYEALFPQAPYVAARMNAELGTEYDVEKLVNWCFDGSNKRGWGESIGKWGGHDFSGIVSSLSGDKNGSYAFCMNTFNKASSLVPMVRYDERFARAVGKWMLNAANSMRLFYANGLPSSHQSDYDWACKHDPEFCLAYEGVKRVRSGIGRIEADYKSRHGRIKGIGVVLRHWTLRLD